MIFWLKPIRWILFGIVLLCLVHEARGLDPNRLPSQYVREEWITPSRFPGGAVNTIGQTADGYLWIGTDKGLIRFDGFNFKFVSFTSDATASKVPILQLLVDAAGTLWLRPQGTDVLRQLDGKFENVTYGAETRTSQITAVSKDSNGGVLLSDIVNGTFRFKGDQIQKLAAPAVLPGSSPIISMAETAEGKIWMGTLGAGLFLFSDGRAGKIDAGLPDRKINCLLPISNEELWVGTDYGLYHGTDKGFRRVELPSSLGSVQVSSMLRDRDSNIWVGTSRGLFRYNANGVSLLSTHETTGPVATLFEDREGSIWIGSARGLERLRDSPFVTYSLPNLKSQSMGPLHVDSGGRTWVAPIQGGLRWLKEGKSGVVTADGIANDVVYSITGTGKDDVWVGRQQGGLTHLRYSGNSFTAKTYTQADGLAQNRVYAVYQSRDGTVWSGTLTRGVSELKNGHFTNYTTTDGLAANTISSIAEGPDGTMWFGTPKGVSAMSQKGWRTYTGNDGLPSEDVNCFLQDSTGILWIGTAEGLAYLSDGHVHVPRGVPESLHAPIFGIEKDKNGWIWIATSDHVLRIPRDKLLSGVVKAVDVREYDQADGLESIEGVKRSRSVVSDSAGRIWFSLSSGLSVVNPSRINDNSVPALPHIEAITADNNTANLAALVQIPPSPRRITFEYTGLSLAVPERIRFRYFLEGFDRSWSQPVAAREAVYTNLGPGSYRFRLVASNSEGLWNGPETAIALNVAPAYYQTYWFRLLCVGAVLLLLWMLYQLRLKQMQREFHMALEARVDERTRIARELHDTLLQSFNGLLLRFQAVSNLLPRRPEEAKQTIDSAIEQASIAITEGRDAVHELRSRGLMTIDLPDSISNFAKELLSDATSGNPPEFRVQVEGAPRNLDPVIRDEVYRITAEALRNAIRHARARQLEVEIRYDEQYLRLRIRDDGKGIDPTVLDQGHAPGHWGLRGMRERARLVGGNLEVWSQLGSGTEIELTIPAASAYAKHPVSRSSIFSRIRRNRHYEHQSKFDSDPGGR